MCELVDKQDWTCYRVKACITIYMIVLLLIYRNVQKLK